MPLAPAKSAQRLYMTKYMHGHVYYIKVARGCTTIFSAGKKSAGKKSGFDSSAAEHKMYRGTGEKKSL